MKTITVEEMKRIIEELPDSSGILVFDENCELYSAKPVRGVYHVASDRLFEENGYESFSGTFLEEKHADVVYIEIY